MSFFKQFPNLRYDLKSNNVFINAKDIFRHVGIKNILGDDVTSYAYYDVLEGERPDTVSQRLYGTPDYYWTFFVIDENMKEGLKSWPKDPATFERELELEFDDYGALVLVPRNQGAMHTFNLLFTQDGFSRSVADTRFVNNVGGETPAGLNLEYPDLRIKRNGKYAKVKKWDNDLLQLQLYHFSDTANGDASASARTTFFADSTAKGFISFSDSDRAAASSPDLDSPRIDFIKNMASTLTKSFVDWSPNFKVNFEQQNSPNWSLKSQMLYDTALEYYSSPSGTPAANAHDGRIAVTFTAFDQMREIYAFSPVATYENLRQAPAYYYGNNSPGNVISAYDAFSLPVVGITGAPPARYFRILATNSDNTPTGGGGGADGNLFLMDVVITEADGTEYPTSHQTGTVADGGSASLGPFTGGGISVSSGYRHSATYPAWKAFDNATSTGFWTLALTDASLNYLDIDFGQVRDISKFTIKVNENHHHATKIRILTSNNSDFSTGVAVWGEIDYQAISNIVDLDRDALEVNVNTKVTVGASKSTTTSNIPQSELSYYPSETITGSDFSYSDGGMYSPDIDVGDQFDQVTSDDFVTNEKNLKDINDVKSKIKVIRPELIEQFVEAYKNLINS